ncbi:MAG: radical SAM protein [Myxococcota bacterium]|nr:radical SAM protein [Myxococcota bacterium]
MRSRILKVVNNPTNPWQSHSVEWLTEPPKVELTLYSDRTKTILSENHSEDLPFRWSLNPYRGCYHGCSYCYARPSHEYLDFGAGTDFERKLVLKEEAPTLLRKRFMSSSWKGELIVFSGNTDCYQPLEAAYGLTRECLKICLEFRNPVSIITKSTLIERDLDLLEEMHQKSHLDVHISIPFWDAEVARAMEPYVPSPSRRMRVIEQLAKRNIPVTVMVSPMIPGLNDSDIPSILREAKIAGAQYAISTMLRLAPAVAKVFEARLRASLPLRADKILNQIRACRTGELSNNQIGHRMKGVGSRWAIIEQLFETHRQKEGLLVPPTDHPQTKFRRPNTIRPSTAQKNTNQLNLF